MGIERSALADFVSPIWQLCKIAQGKKSKIQLGEREKECGCGGIKCAEVNQEVEVEVTQECRVNL